MTEPTPETEPIPEPDPEPTEPTPPPEEVEPVPEVVPQSTSVFFKIARAVDGDDDFNLRAGMALELSGLEESRSNLISIAKSVVDSIDCTIDGTVSTERVTDEQISTAITNLM